MNEFANFRPDARTWAALLSTALRDEPVPETLSDAIRPLAALAAQPDEDGDVWNQQSFDFMMLIFEEGLNDLYERLGLREYNREFAKAIYANTLQQPPIFRLCTKQLVRKETRTQDGWVSENVRATLPFYKLLTAALVSLPAGFRHREQAYRGVKHVYPYLEDHRPEAHFSPGQKVVWFEAKSSSRLREVTQHTLFCGTTGPRTIFTVQEPLTGFRIEEFSSYGPDEAEVLFTPLSVFEVVSVRKNWNQQTQRGSPDEVVLKQVESQVFKVFDLFPGAAAVSAPLPSTGSSQAAAASPPATAQVSVVPSPAAPATGAGYAAAGGLSQAVATSSAAATAAEQDAEEEEPWAGGEEWELEAKLQGHADQVMALAALDAQTLASASHDHTLKLWDLAARRCTATLTGHTNKVFALCRLSAMALASGSLDKTVRIWDVPTSRCLATLQGHTDWVRATCRLSEQTVASASHDGSVKLWDLRTSGCVATLTGHRHWVLALCVPSEGVVASGSSDRTVRLWEAAAGFRCRATLEGHTGGVLALCPLAGGGLACGDNKGRVRFWEPGGARSLEVHAAFFSSSVWALCRLGTGAVASGGDHDRHVRVWDSASGARLGELDTGCFVYAVCRVQGTALATSGAQDVFLWRGR